MLINPNGFREYDARWLYRKEIDLLGVEDLGKGLGTQIIQHTKKSNPRVIVGHDYRSYSEEIKSALKKGLISTGCFVEDIGLSLSPTVYFAQFNLNADAVAMVTASHNENGWTGVKMGIKKGLTHAPEEMSELKEITLNKKFIEGKGSNKNIDNFKQIYIQDLIKKNKIKKKIKAVVACGNGTAGIFAPEILKGVGCEVIELDCKLDWSFPKYNPNPENLEMLHAISKAVKDNNADIGFGFDGDGDRCGVIDEKGNEIFSDKIGLLIARNLAPKHKNSKFVVDVKSTGLYSTDEVLSENISFPSLSITPHRSPSPSKPKPISALLSLTAFDIACNISRSSGFGLYFGKLQSNLQSNSTTSQPIPLKMSGANIPAVPFPQATTALIFLFILFLFIKSFL